MTSRDLRDLAMLCFVLALGAASGGMETLCYYSVLVTATLNWILPEEMEKKL